MIKSITKVTDKSNDMDVNFGLVKESSLVGTTVIAADKIVTANTFYERIVIYLLVSRLCPSNDFNPITPKRRRVRTK